jgi:amino acid transporter, AAT family
MLVGTNQPEQLTDEGLKQGLETRHIRMIAIAGAIGTGLFLGAGKGLHNIGPALIGVYAVVGAFIFVIMRALGELLIYRPVNGSFAEYANEFLGPIYGFVTGWGYWLTWNVIGMAELTAAGKYVNLWFPNFPQYATALVMLCTLTALNLIAVAAFGEAEFWFAGIKVAAIMTLIIGGTLVVVFHIGNIGKTASPARLFNDGGFVPNGWVKVLLAIQMVVFAYQGVELIGMAAAETKNRQTVLPKAINSIPVRVGIFYIGSLTVLLCLFSWREFSAAKAPFVQALGGIGISGAADIMNFVVLTACLSACSSGLFSNGRLLKRLADDGMAPRRLGDMSNRHVPALGILASAGVMSLGVLINVISPDQAFAWITSVASVGGVWAWAVILACLLVYRRRVAAGLVPESSFRLRLAGPLCWATLGFLALVIVLLAADAEQRVGLYCGGISAVIMVAGYYLFGRRGMAERERRRALDQSLVPMD